MSTIINVANRLPITVGETITKSSGGLVAALEGLSDHDLQWIGWPGGVIAEDRQEDITRVLREQYNARPVFLSEAEEQGFYEGFANSSIWPLLHYLPTYMRFEPEWWEEYRRVNQKFADAVLEVVRADSGADSGADAMVWVHDYQLMLVPSILRAAMPTLRIGFFLHTPFPSYEIYRCHPLRVELLEGLLGADQIGFHTFGYMRHFRSSVLRLLGIDSEITRLTHNGHTSVLGIYPIGINAAKFDEQLDKPEHAAEVKKLKDNFGDKRLIVSVERMDYTKGILHRLQAIDLFLKAAKENGTLDDVKFLFVSVPSRENVEEYKDLREEVESQIGRINGRYATVHNSPIHFIHDSVPFTELAALYAMADVALIAPLVDGMNLVAKEYVAAQRDDPGVLVLSEFAGAAEELFNAILVNPYNATEMASAVTRALAMDPQERADRMRPMRERVKNFDANWWARQFIDDLTGRSTVGADVFPAADAEALLAGAMGTGKPVLLFLDWDGTLREIERVPDRAGPTPEICKLFDQLKAVSNIEITIISGRSQQDMERWFDQSGITLIAEHGAAVRRAGQREWEQLDRNVSYAWKPEIMKVFKLYVDSTPGASVEEKRSSLVWHYRNSDPEFGGWKASLLENELRILMANEPVEIRHGKKIVEITAAQVNKGAAVARELEGRPVELVVIAGDDLTDESMFRLDLPNMLGIKIGDGDTHARYRVATPAGFRQLLAQAVACQGR